MPRRHTRPLPARKIPSTLPQLQPEIWRVVFEQLRRPLPAAHAARYPPRSAIRQSDLAVCLRVNKEWYSLAAPVLYAIAVTDDLALFLNGIFSPFTGGNLIPHIYSKLDLVGRVRHLYVEYSDKSVDVAYSDLMEFSNFHELIASERVNDGWRDLQGVKEARSLGKAFGELYDEMSRPDRRPKGIFPRLKTLSTGAFYGQQDDVFRNLGPSQQTQTNTLLFQEEVISRIAHAENPMPGERILLCQLLLNRFIRTTPSLQHVCVSGHSGPLAINSSTAAKTGQSIPLFAAHSEVPVVKTMPFAYGVRTRWYQHVPVAGQPEAVLQWLPKAGTEVVFQREKMLDARGKADGFTSLDMKGELYLPFAPRCVPDRYTTEAEKQTWRQVPLHCEMELHKVISTGNAYFPKRYKGNDKLLVRNLYDAPACEACGWQYEE